jgi:hypothetical protein
MCTQDTISNAQNTDGCTGANSFREKRAVKRVEFFSRSEELIAVVHASLKALVRQSPQMDLIGFFSDVVLSRNSSSYRYDPRSRLNGSPRGNGKKKGEDLLNDVFANKLSKLGKTNADKAIPFGFGNPLNNEKGKSGNLLERFVYHIEKAAGHFSRMFYYLI